MKSGIAAEKQEGPDEVDGHKRDRDRHAGEQKDSRTPQEKKRGHLPGHDHDASPVTPGVQAAETASSRKPTSATDSRYMRKMNSIARRANPTGRGASVHHSGVMRVLMLTDPAR